VIGRRFLSASALFMFVGCGSQSASQNIAEISSVPQVTVAVESSDTSVVEAPETTSTMLATSTVLAISTTSTTLAPVSTTVLDTLCIRLTQCQFANLVAVDFSRLQLDFQNFSAASLNSANFSGANLAKSLFIRADLTQANFNGANLSGVDFTAAQMSGANLEGANLTDAIFCDVDLKSVLGLTDAQLNKTKKFKTKGKVFCP